MTHKCFNLFLISECLNGRTKLPVHTFVGKDFTMAKLYFHDWLEGKKCKAKFQLYKIGEINKDLRITETKIYITSGFELERNPKTAFQETLWQEKNRIEAASKQKELKEIVKTLFDGMEI